MKVKQVSKIALSSLLGVTLLAGCGSGAKTIPYGTAGDGEVTVNLGAEPPELASFLTSDSTSGDVLRHSIEGLVTLDEKDEAQPGVAESWDVNGSQVVFHLRDNATWSNGEPVTAQDFEYAWDQLFTLKNAATYAETWKVYFNGLTEVYDAQKDEVTDFATAKKQQQDALGDSFGYYAKDEKTFVVNFTGEYPYAVNLLAFYNFAPINQKFYEEAGTAIGETGTYGNDANTLLYNGPFIITSWEHENQIVMEKNPNYWDAENIKLNKITWKMIKDSNTWLNDFENGTLDLTGLTGEQAKSYRDGEVEVPAYMDGSTWYLQYNTERTDKALNNAKVREALTLACNFQPYIDEVLMNESVLSNTLTSSAVRNGEFVEYVNQTLPRPEGEDYSEVKALLEEGLKEEGLSIDTFEVSILGDTGDSALRNYTYIQNQLQTNLGIKVNIDQVEFKTRIARMKEGDFDIVYAGWSPDYNDPMSYLDLFVTGGGNNDGKYSNPEYDALIKAAFSEKDSAKRDEMLKEAENILATDYPIGVLYQRSADYIVSGKLKGVSRTAFSKTDLRRAYTVSEEEAGK